MAKEFYKLLAIRSGIILGLLAFGAAADATRGKVNPKETLELAGKGLVLAVISSGGVFCKRRVFSKTQEGVKKKTRV